MCHSNQQVTNTLPCNKNKTSSVFLSFNEETFSVCNDSTLHWFYGQWYARYIIIVQEQSVDYYTISSVLTVLRTHKRSPFTFLTYDFDFTCNGSTPFSRDHSAPRNKRWKWLLSLMQLINHTKITLILFYCRPWSEYI